MTDVSRGATPLSPSPWPSSSSQLTLHPFCLLPHRFPQSFSAYCTTGGLGVCGPDIFCKQLEDDFSSVFTEQMFPSLPPPLPCNCRKLSLPQRTHGVAALCLIRRARAGTRESHTDDCLAGELQGVCVFLFPFFPLQL